MKKLKYLIPIFAIIACAGLSFAASTFPTSYDNLPTVSSGDTITSAGWNNIIGAINNIQDKIGIDSSATSSTIDFNIYHTNSKLGSIYNVATGTDGIILTLRDGLWTGVSSSTLPFMGNSLTAGNFYIGSQSNTAVATSSIFMDSGGNIGVGTQSPDNLFHIYSGDSGGASIANVIDLTVENDSDVGIQLLGPSANYKGIYFGDENSAQQIELSLYQDNYMCMYVDNKMAQVWDTANRYVGIGTSTTPDALLYINEWEDTATTMLKIINNNGTLFTVDNTGTTTILGDLSLSGGLTIGTPLATGYGGTGTSTALAEGYLWIGTAGGELDIISSSTLSGGTAVDNLNGISGEVVLEGTANRITISSSSQTITLTAPQDIHTGASPTFAGLTLSGITDGFIKVNGSGVFSTTTIGAVDLTAEDFGDFTCNGTTCSLDANSVQDNEIDYSAVTLGDFTDDINNATTGYTGWDLSDSVNLTAGDYLTLTDDDIDLDSEIASTTISFNLIDATTTSEQHAFIPSDFTIERAYCYSIGGTSTVNILERDGSSPFTAGTSTISAQTCGHGTRTLITSLGDATVANGSILVASTTAVSVNTGYSSADTYFQIEGKIDDQ